MHATNKSLFTCCRHDKRISTKEALVNAAQHEKTRVRNKRQSSKKRDPNTADATPNNPDTEPDTNHSTPRSASLTNSAPVEQPPSTTDDMDKLGNNELTFRVPRARLCVLHKWPNYDGYGFSLIGHRGGCSQYINSVEPNSPADKGGLRVADRVIAVNGKNVCNIPHKLAVSYIVEKPDRVELLLLGPEVHRFYQQHNLPIHADTQLMERFETPVTTEVTGEEEDEDHHHYQQPQLMLGAPSYGIEIRGPQHRLLEETNFSLNSTMKSGVDSTTRRKTSKRDCIKLENLTFEQKLRTFNEM